MPVGSQDVKVMHPVVTLLLSVMTLMLRMLEHNDKVYPVARKRLHKPLKLVETTREEKKVVPSLLYGSVRVTIVTPLTMFGFLKTLQVTHYLKLLNNYIQK